ncbi:hypothetical protein EV182_004027 [Spiromyces aspiralis]|uniref:Uncharacterized protein n=1 Tax=Spiromyces aspiralis TaxID=68401 RepID=A0ACC1HT82_9FUNG|nr:hypothetical protein EV182_004027 [Spiromyces aspiralis]
MHPTQDNNHLQRGLSLASQQLRDLASNPPSIGESNLPSTPQAQHHPEISQSLPNRSDLGLSSTTSPSSIAHPRKASAGSLGHHNYHSQRSPGWSIYGLGHIPIQRDPSGLPDMADDAHIPARPPPSHSVNPGVAASRIATNDSVSNASACSGLQASGRSAASSFSTTTSSSSSSVPPAVSSSLAVTASMLQHMRIPENHRHQFGNAAPYIKPNEPFLRSNSDRLAAPSSPQKLPQLPARSTSSTSAAHPHGADNYYSSQTDLIKPAEHSQKLIPAYRSHSNHSVGSVGSGKKRAAQLDTLLGDLMLELEALSTRATTKATTAATVAADSDIESMYSYQSSNNRNITVSPVPMARSASPLKGHGGQIRHLLQQQQQHSHVQTCAKGHEPTGYAAEAITVADAIDSYGNDDSDVNNKHESPGRHMCGACHKVIASTDPDKDLKVFGQYWHAHHLACFTCGVNLSDTTERYERDGRIYCQADYQNLSVANCIACNRPHSPHDSLIALNARWHISCFNCQVCHQKFPDRSFYMLENKPYCRYHYHELNNSLCKKCSEPIEGACAQVVEGRFHPGCFVCETCQQPLRDIYYNFNNKFYCEKHVVPQRATDNSRRRTIFCDL